MVGLSGLQLWKDKGPVMLIEVTEHNSFKNILNITKSYFFFKFYLISMDYVKKPLK